MVKFLLYTIVFLSGAIFLVLEIIASRVLAPFFGNSVFVWGSLISVFLFGLSLGYFWGGILADYRPTFKVLALIILISSLFVAIIPFISYPIGGVILSYDLDLRLAVLLAAVFYFLVPSILMGMVSPYVIKLNTREFAVLGQSAGTIYAMSTMGSIIGALLTSFYLIIAFGTRAILWGSSAVLFMASCLCLICWKLMERSSEEDQPEHQSESQPISEQSRRDGE